MCDQPIPLKLARARVANYHEEIDRIDGVPQGRRLSAYIKGVEMVPCGKCYKCKKRRVGQWVFRLQQEQLHSKTAYFITLTYDENHVFYSDKGWPSLNKKDTQLFFKRLRQCQNRLIARMAKANTNKKRGRLSQTQSFPLSTLNELRKLVEVKDGRPRSKPIRYYLVGEYGGLTQRPHYHVILFNAATAALELAWHLGGIHIGTVTTASVRYTLKYISKASKRKPYSDDDRVAEFTTQSKGLGAAYVTPSVIAWHHAKLMKRMCVTAEDGSVYSMPRNLKKLIYSESQLKAYAARFRMENTLQYGDDRIVEMKRKQAASERYFKTKNIDVL